ncbi:dnaJ homolog subfamily B member 12-like [Copidosoma floridanum]|uniref:dnaJ homolog subfamily B member 12-like n=1 Tax=Copidosoma floridanum TaxID=29053 RepID=UPI000C6FB3EA|nr:dnaJ homolog subfamily B member 12-like [Copidosoma floridanum]
MDGNKDEANRCTELAERCVREKRFDEAVKFLKKAQRLFPTKKAEDLLATVTLMSKQQSAKVEPEAEVRKRHGNASKSNGAQTQASAADYTDEQMEHIKRINKCKDYYEILAVSKDATDSDVKKAYRKLALHLHPDKNRAPGANEAFKAVGNAAKILMDPEKRKQYDLYGSEEERLSTTRHSHSHYNYSRGGFEADVTAEELFNMFFGGFPQQEFYVRRGGGRWMRQNEAQHQHTHSQQQANTYTTFLQMLPVLLLIILTMMSSFFMSDPIYSLHQSSKYSIQRTTIKIQ